MRSHELLSRALLVSSLYTGTEAASLTKRQVVCADVNIRDLRDTEEAAQVWHDSGAGVIGDEYISEHGLENWVQNLDQDIFDVRTDVSDSWDCGDWETECKLENECSEYAEVSEGDPGAYFLFYSLQQLRSWIKSFHERLQDNAIRETLDIFRVEGDFEKDDKSQLNVAVIIAASLGILAGAGAASPLFAGSLGVIAGAASATGNILPPQANNDDAVPELAERVQTHFEDIRKYLDNLNGAVFGKSGFEQDLIPPEMIKQTFANPAIGALGDGQWLSADPTAGLGDAMEEMYRRMRQGLAWGMLRHAHRAFVFIDNPVEEHECGYNFNAAVWDPDNGFCFRLFQVNGGDRIVPVPDHLADKLWENPYGLDRLEVYRNAFDCWVENKGGVAEPEYLEGLEPGTVPKCFFSMKVARGTYLKHGFADPEIIMSDWLNQENNYRWNYEDW